jgi:lysozyme family protein
MAKSEILAPFILAAEGGHCNVPGDAGGETNKGVTYSEWKTVFGDTHDRFLIMSSEDWNTIFKKEYWDKALGDQINSQRIANTIVDWVFNSGKYYPEADVQDILIHTFGAHIGEDGNFGPATIAAINQADEQKLYEDIIAKRLWFFDQCVLSHPTNAKFLTGWQNRIKHLQEFNNTLT